ncbi:MAG: CoA-binding protein [Nitrososphaerota archaeon]|nr:CoA-binding protein [Candidatus Calditenuaceae archaeon]MDW8073061.1 CoA-binding protein [Nitrososphaerota archaeon]
MTQIDIPKDGLTDLEVYEVLTRSKRIAVVGMSRDPQKPANFVPRYLISKGYIVLPVNPSASEILGLRSYRSLLELDTVVDVVDVFRPSEEVPAVAEQALKIRPRVFWMQEGIYSESAARLLASNGIKVVWNRCMMREHMRLLGQGSRQPRPAGPIP